MTTGGNTSYRQLGLDAMMSGCFVSEGGGGSSIVAADAPFFHDCNLGLGGDPADVVAASLLADGSVLAGQLVRATALQDGVAGGYGGPAPSDVTIAHAPMMSKFAGEPEGSWIHEPYYWPTPTWFSGDSFRNPFAAASELSLRLLAEPSASPAGTVVSGSLPDRSPEVSCSVLTHASGGSAGRSLLQPPGALHFSQVLSRWSGYAHITQQTLDEFVGCLLQDVAAGFASFAAAGGEASWALPSSSCASKTTSSSNPPAFLATEEQAHQKLKDDLRKLLQIMDQRCNQCMDEIQSAASKYGSMVLPGGGALSAPFAHRAVSVMHRRLRARIMGEIAAATRRCEPSSSSSLSLADRERSWESAFIQKHWALRQLRRGDQQSWRPQRGLPEKSVAVLKAWMFENFLRPYPKDNEKEMLAARSGLSRSQVSNWFINARVRLWKPMIEEMYEDLKKASEEQMV